MRQLAQQFEAFRLQLIGQLEHEQRRLHEQAAKLNAEQQQLDLKRPRLKAQAPGEDVCPNCFFHRGASSLLAPMDGGDDRVDLWRCSACGYETETENPR